MYGERSFLLLSWVLFGCHPASSATLSPTSTSKEATSATAPASTSTPSTATATQSAPAAPPNAFTQEGLATYYADSLHGRKTASGEVYDKTAFTCAHKTLKFGTYVRVESLTNGKSVTVKVNDRGPFSSSRIIDLSRAAAEQIDLIKPGKMKVKITVVSEPERN